MTSASARAKRPTKHVGWVRRHWRSLTPRGKKVVVGVPVGGFLLLVLLSIVLYLTTDLPEASPNEQSVTVLYSDGKTELGRLQGDENRTDVPLASLPEHVRQAVLAAEDEDFYQHSGVSPSGIARAFWRNVRGGKVSQGGSTITQQYAKTAYLTRKRTITRKIREVFVAIKLERRLSKDEILERYLNRIYFGRGAYGIEAASRTYFNIPASKMSVEQAALLATLIRAPEGGDPSRHREIAETRWRGVLDNMAEEGWLDAAKAERAKFPAFLPRGKGGGRNRGRLSGPTGHLVEAVRRELEALGYSPDDLAFAGLTVTTTIDKKAQDGADAAMADVLKEAPKDLLSALVAVEPGTGRIRAMYGGRDYTTRFQNDATDALRQPGSSFKPYVLATALEEDIGLRSRYDGSSPQRFPGRERPVSNYGDTNNSFGRIDLIEATAKSVNTVFYGLALDAGPRDVIETAHAAGIPDEDEDPRGLRQPVTLRREGGLGLGESEVHVLDQATGFATFAAQGKSALPFIVENVAARKGGRSYTAKPKVDANALDPQVTADVTYALQQVVARGTAQGARLDGGRPAAGKTGTSQNNRDAWFVGYTPSLSAAVWMGFENPDEKQLRNILGRSAVTGGSFPAQIWKAFMDGALAGTDVQNFPPPAFVGTDRDASPTPTPSTTTCPAPVPLPVPVGSPCPSASPTETASPTVSPTLLPTKSPKPTKSPEPTGEPSPTVSPSAQPTGEPSPAPSDPQQTP